MAHDQVGAREKLNAVVLGCATFVAAGIGMMCGSWLVFGLALIALLVLSQMGGQLRLTSRSK